MIADKRKLFFFISTWFSSGNISMHVGVSEHVFVLQRVSNSARRQTFFTLA